MNHIDMTDKKKCLTSSPDDVQLIKVGTIKTIKTQNSAKRPVLTKSNDLEGTLPAWFNLDVVKKTTVSALQVHQVRFHFLCL